MTTHSIEKLNNYKETEKAVNKQYTIHNKTEKTTIESWHGFQIHEENTSYRIKILKITQTQLKQKSKDSIFSYKFQAGH